jgi:hypothetical protein
MNPDELELAPGTEHQNLEGRVWQAANEDELREGIEKAFDYRGDVTITKKDGTRVEGYLFDRKSEPTLAASLVRVILKDQNQKIAVSYAEIAGLAFTGRDTAAGKSWEAWVKKHAEKQASSPAISKT